MADPRAVLEWAIPRVAQRLRGLPGAAGGMGVYFSTQQRLQDDPQDRRWPDDVRRLLRLADRRLAAGRIDSALRWFDKALRISYHGSLHQTGHSPLVADPESFLARLRESRLGEILLDGRPPRGSVPARPAPRPRRPGEPLRVVVLAQGNWTFIRPILRGLEESGQVEVRELDVDQLEAPGFASRDEILRGRYDLVTTGRRMPTPPELQESFDWADVVLVEWFHHVLTWVTLLDRAPRSLAARVHRFEAFTPFCLLHDHQRLEAVLYVSPPVWSLLCALTPDIEGVRPVQVGNLLSRGLGEEPAQDRDLFRLVQVGWLREVKDVLFSLDLIQRLRQEDERYHLQLVGPGLPADARRDTSYQRIVRRRLQQLGPEAVQPLGVREDVPAICAQAGFILSSSRHEGTHEAVMEGLAAGCVGVIRDWPDSVPYGGAGTIYRDQGVVGSVEAAAQRVLGLRDREQHAEASRSARAFALRERSPDGVIAGYLRALDPGPPR